MDRHQALEILDKLLVVFGVPEHHAVGRSFWPNVRVHQGVGTVAPLLKIKRVALNVGVEGFRPGFAFFFFSLYLVVWSYVGKIQVGVHSQGYPEACSLPGNPCHLFAGHF